MWILIVLFLQGMIIKMDKTLRIFKYTTGFSTLSKKHQKLFVNGVSWLSFDAHFLLVRLIWNWKRNNKKDHGVAWQLLSFVNVVIHGHLLYHPPLKRIPHLIAFLVLSPIFFFVHSIAPVVSKHNTYTHFTDPCFFLIICFFFHHSLFISY